MEKILYIHGIGSGKGSRTSEAIKEAFPEYEVHAPEIPVSPKEAMQFLNDLFEENQYKIIVGASLGAFYAIHMKNCIKFLINPAMYAADDIPTAIGYGVHEFVKPRSDSAKTYVVDDKFVSELREIQGSSKILFALPAEWVLTYALFGTKDNIVNHQDDFHDVYDNTHMLTADFGHRLTLDVLQNVFIPFMKDSLIEVANYPGEGIDWD